MVVHLTCGCLNVHIHVNEKHFTPLSTKERKEWFQESSLMAQDDAFFQGLAPVTLALGGISKEHNYLCRERNIGQWSVTRCVICGLDTHAVRITSQNQSHILVNVNMESDPSKILSMKQSDKYSAVFRVLLEPRTTAPDNRGILARSMSVQANFQQNTEGSSKISGVGGRNSHVDAASTDLHNRVSLFYKEEQAAMEERIRTFTEQEHSRFATMQLKVNREKDLLVNCLRKLELAPKSPQPSSTTSEGTTKKDAKLENDMANDIGLLMENRSQFNKESETSKKQQDYNVGSQPNMFGVNQNDRRVSSYRYSGSLQAHDITSTTANNYAKPSSTVNVNPPKNAKPAARRQSRNNLMNSMPSDEEEGIMFDMEGLGPNELEESMDDVQAPDYGAFDSSDESPGNSSDEATPGTNMVHNYGRSLSSRQYAASVPISVPHWVANHAKDEEDEPHVEVQSIERLAESFRAHRTNSVVDGTELFGDLPRRTLI